MDSTAPAETSHIDGENEEVSWEFDCPQYTDFALEEEMDENSEVTNEDGFFAVREQYQVFRNNIPDEWLRNIEKKINVEGTERSMFHPSHPNYMPPQTKAGASNGGAKDADNENGENENSINVNVDPSHGVPDPRKPLTPDSESRKEVVLDQYTAPNEKLPHPSFLQDSADDNVGSLGSEGSPVPDLLSPDLNDYDGPTVDAFGQEATVDEWTMDDAQALADSGLNDDDDQMISGSPDDAQAAAASPKTPDQDLDAAVDDETGLEEQLDELHLGPEETAGHHVEDHVEKNTEDTASAVQSDAAAGRNQTPGTPARSAETPAVVKPAEALEHKQAASTPAQSGSAPNFAATPPMPPASPAAAEAENATNVSTTAIANSPLAAAEMETPATAQPGTPVTEKPGTPATTQAKTPGARHPDTPATSTAGSPVSVTNADAATPATRSVASPAASPAMRFTPFESRIPRSANNATPGHSFMSPAMHSLASPSSRAQPFSAASRIPRSGQKAFSAHKERGRSMTRHNPGSAMRSGSVKSSRSFASGGGTPSYMLPTDNWSRNQEEHNNAQRRPGGSRRATPGSGGYFGTKAKAVSRPKLTEPQTPSFMKNVRPRRANRPSSTTVELERARQELEDRRRELEKRPEEIQRVLASNNVPKPAKKPLTKGEAPSLQLDQRLGSKKVTPNSASKKDAPEANARPSAAKNGPVRLTKPKDFQFATDKRVGGRHPEASESAPFESLASQVHNFLHKTPARYKHRTGLELPAKSVPQLTEPEEPKFHTDMRLRAPVAKSREELEEEALKNFKPFKARPLPDNVMHSNGEVGVPKVEKKAPVVPKAFNFRTDQRASTRRPNDENAPMNQATTRPRRNSLGSQRNLGKSWVPKPTRFAPFNLRTDSRATTRPMVASPSVFSDPEQERSFHARPMPNFNRPPNVPTVNRRELSAPAPFNLQGLRRHEIAMQRRQEELQRQQEEEERARHFKARPICVPVNEPAVLASEKPLTEPATPMALRRSILKQQAREERLAQERQEEMERHQFHARQLPRSTFEKTFELKLPGRVSGVLDIKLQSDIRAEQRREFDRMMEEKLRMQEEERMREEERKRLEEEEAIREYRKTLVSKARPMPSYSRGRGTARMPTPPRLTQPESPFLVTKARGGPKNAHVQ